MKYLRSSAIAIILFIVLTNVPDVKAQGPSVHTTGLQGPTKITNAGQSHLLVAETGSASPNTGRISLVDKGTGVRSTLIDSLPSAFNTIEHAPSGPSGLKLVGLKLYVTIGQGDSVIAGGRGGLVANPAPATTLNNSVIELTLPPDYEALESGFVLPVNAQKALAAGGLTVLHNAQDKTLTLRLVANLPDYQVENQPGLPQGNVRPANVFGLEMARGDLYAVDASFNAMYKINPVTGQYSIFTTFDPVPNKLPFGPPFSDAVPNNVRLLGDRLLVTILVGFPFEPGSATVLQVSLDDASQSSQQRGLTSPMDAVVVPLSGLNEPLYVLEFSQNMLSNPTPPGRLKLFIDEEVSVVIVDDLISPTSMARDGDTGDIFITEIFTGRIIRVPGGYNPQGDVTARARGRK